jgi:SAM-dependent MidA family methyltransferase
MPVPERDAAPGVRWRAAMAEALYGPGGFFVAGGAGPAGHFRTSANSSALFAGALVRLVSAVDAALGQPRSVDLVDVGAGRGELLRAMLALAPPELAARLRPVAVEKAPRPTDLPPRIAWTDTIPADVTGVLVATEWLDNVPLDIVEVGPDGVARYLLVDPTGRESLGGPVDPADQAWLARWWPPAGGRRAEPGLPRDEAWATAVAAVHRGLAVAVDYGHLRSGRPFDGSLTGFRDGRQVTPIPDGSCDLTAHVAIDAVAEAGGRPYTLIDQRAALRALGVDGARPPLALAGTDPAGYVRALSAASAAAELTDPAGLGGHHWLLHPRGIDPRAVGPPLERGTMPS